MSQNILTLDIGTTSLKTALFCDGNFAASKTFPFANPDDRFIAQEWLSITNQISQDFSSYEISAISISGNGPTLVTENGLTFRWNEIIDENKILNQNLKSICENSIFLPRIIAMKTLFPKEFSESSMIFSGPEWLIWKLTGKSVTILPEKRYESAYWNKIQLEKLNINPKKLPPFSSIGNCFGKTLKNQSIPENLPVYGCGPDFIAAMIGTGCTKPGILCDCAGSSEGFNLCITKPVKDSRIRLLPSVTKGLWNAAVLIPQSGRLLHDYKKSKETETERKWTYEELIDYCFDNHDSQGWKILSALLENSKNAVSILREVALQSEIAFPDTMFIAGGQAKNERWLKEKSKALGLKLQTGKIADAELLGDLFITGQKI